MCVLSSTAVYDGGSNYCVAQHNRHDKTLLPITHSQQQAHMVNALGMPRSTCPRVFMTYGMAADSSSFGYVRLIVISYRVRFCEDRIDHTPSSDLRHVCSRSLFLQHTTALRYSLWVPCFLLYSFTPYTNIAPETTLRVVGFLLLYRGTDLS